MRTISPTGNTNHDRQDPPHPGDGHLRLCLSRPPSTSTTSPSPDGSTATFTRLSASYPLKLLPPTRLPSQPRCLGVCYMLAYGGGLVAGDEISLRVQVGEGARLVLLTQGSTKVFKNRPGLRPMSGWHKGSHGGSSIVSTAVTRQRLLITLEPSSIFLLLPDPIQPFRDSSYSQSQRIAIPAYPGSSRTSTLPAVGRAALERSSDPICADGSSTTSALTPPASLLLLDWFTSGRKHSRTRTTSSTPSTSTSDQAVPNGTLVSDSLLASSASEQWDFARYSSLNEVVDTEGKVIMREVLVLDGDRQDPRHSIPVHGPPSSSTLATRLLPYTIYATLLIHGPAFRSLLTFLQSLTRSPSSTQFQAARPDSLLWSFSPVDHHRATTPDQAHASETGPEERGGMMPRGGVFRVAGTETEAVKGFLSEVLVMGRVKDLVGDVVWDRVF